ncbi:GIY-YIG nuclease family protein [Rhodococcus gordoniae]
MTTGSTTEWSTWIPLLGISRNAAVPRLPGIYRVRRRDFDGLDYIGQTGRSLRERLGALSRCHAEQMPYRDPHTAAPALWALRHATGCEFEVSFAATDGDSHTRKGQEALAVGLYRQEFGASPTVQFGRIPEGYRASSSNNARLVAAGARFRGDVYDGPPLAEHRLGAPPVGPLTHDTQSPSWCGHRWSAWVALSNARYAIPANTSGLYRLRGDYDDALLYIGQGVLPNRPLAHLAKIAAVGHAQGAIFAEQHRLEVSWVAAQHRPVNQLLELENDLIAAHVLHLNIAPTAQFKG